MNKFRFMVVAAFLAGLLQGCLPAVHRAVIKNDVSDLSKLSLEQINERDENGRTALSLAVSENNRAMINALIAAGESVDHRDRYGRTAMLEAIELKRYDAMTELLGKGANPDAYGTDGKTGLHMSASKGLTRYVKSLAEHKANVNIQEGRSLRAPLHWAAYNGHKGAVETLLAMGANPMTQDRREKTPLDLAFSRNKTDIAKSIISHLGRNYVDEDGNNILHMAAASGNMDLFESMMKANNSGINALNKSNESPIDVLEKSVTRKSAQRHEKLLAIEKADRLKQRQINEKEQKRRAEAAERKQNIAMAMGLGMAALGASKGLAPDKAMELGAATYSDVSSGTMNNMNSLNQKWKAENTARLAQIKGQTAGGSSEADRNRKIAEGCSSQALQYSDGDGQSTPHCQQAIKNQCTANALCGYYPDKCGMFKQKVSMSCSILKNMGVNSCPSCK